MRTDWVARRAKLLETGIYRDKQVVLTRSHLQRIVRTFRAPVPIFVEHCPSPVLLGWVRSVWVDGDSLYGLLLLYPEADALLRRLRVRGLSVGLSADLGVLREVSVTGNPRVASAQLFARPKDVACMMNIRNEWDSDGESAMEVVPAEVTMAERVRALEWQVRQYQARALVERWIAEGRLAPVQSEIAEAILMSDANHTVSFREQAVPVSTLFRQFVESLPQRDWLGEAAPAPNEPSPAFTAEELAFLRQVFPDLNPAEILANKEVR